MKRPLALVLTTLAVATAAAPTSADSTASPLGRWLGDVEIVRGDAEDDSVDLRITALRRGARAGSVRYGAGCGGPITFVRRTRDSYRFRHRETLDRGGCTLSDQIDVHVERPNLILVEIVARTVDGERIVARGALRKDLDSPVCERGC